MDIILGLSVLVLMAIVIRLTAKFLLKKIIKFENRLKEKEKQKNNIYINYHKFKRRNHLSYQEYLEWLDKNNSRDVPVDKIKFQEDEMANAKIDGLFKDKKLR